MLLPGIGGRNDYGEINTRIINAEDVETALDDFRRSCSRVLDTTVNDIEEMDTSPIKQIN